MDTRTWVFEVNGFATFKSEVLGLLSLLEMHFPYRTHINNTYFPQSNDVYTWESYVIEI